MMYGEARASLAFSLSPRTTLPRGSSSKKNLYRHRYVIGNSRFNEILISFFFTTNTFTDHSKLSASCDRKKTGTETFFSLFTPIFWPSLCGDLGTTSAQIVIDLAWVAHRTLLSRWIWVVSSCKDRVCYYRSVEKILFLDQIKTFFLFNDFFH